MNFLSPAEVAEAVCGAGKKKTELSFENMALLGILAGVYIAFGAQLMTMVTHDLAKYFGLGFAQFLGGSVFSVGLMMVVIGGAELWTGNNLITVAALSGRATWGGLLRNWVVVYLSNFVGSVMVAWIMYQTGLWAFNGNLWGARALAIANGKVNLTWSQGFFRGIMCNWLVCMAVWLAFAGKDVVSKIFGIYFPIMAFVASGFEHSIANMYFVPLGIFLSGNDAVVQAANLAGKTGNLTWGGFISQNLIPVTLGNLVGGALFVGAVYWAIFMRGKPAVPPVSTGKAA